MKSIPSFSNQALSAEQDDLPLSQPEAATEEPPEQLPPPPVKQIPPEPPAAVHKSETPVTPAGQVAEQEDSKLPVQEFSSLSPSDTGHPESQTAISIISLLPPVQAATTATSLPLNAASSVPPVLTLPTQASHPEVELSLLLLLLLLVLYVSTTLSTNLQNQDPNCTYLQGLNGQPVMAAPVFTKVQSSTWAPFCSSCSSGY